MGADLNNIVKCQKLTDDHVQFLIYQILRGLKVRSLPGHTTSNPLLTLHPAHHRSANHLRLNCSDISQIESGVCVWRSYIFSEAEAVCRITCIVGVFQFAVCVAELSDNGRASMNEKKMFLYLIAGLPLHLKQTNKYGKKIRCFSHSVTGLPFSYLFTRTMRLFSFLAHGILVFVVLTL